ncbi:hypothetical protein DKX38_029581 [Salix brachista]|uniref:Uncharacterized protein n=1 Tax=Salix brachista TaxID=2182728 RepID=A0A5N5J5A1_9ROSI|nr:hypothetical protein DKX38_029581 [Salix brachista]
MSKTLMVFGLTVMVVCACFANVPTVAGTNSPSPVIGYGAIGQGANFRCRPSHPIPCSLVPANPYHRVVKRRSTVAMEEVESYLEKAFKRTLPSILYKARRTFCCAKGLDPKSKSLSVE